MFKQANLITKGTSNMHPNHIITNILVRVQEETRLNTNYDPLESEESETAKLAAVLDGLPNTFISYKWI